MATRGRPKKQIVQPPQGADLVEDDQEDFYNYDAMAPRLAEIRADLGIEGEMDATARVYKVTPGAKRNPEVWEGLPEQYDLHRIAQDHGSGEYRYILWVRDTTGMKVRRMDYTLAVMLTPREEGALNAARLAATNPNAAPAPQSNAGEIRDAISGMMAGFQETVRALVQNRPDPMEEMQRMATIMKMFQPAPAAAGGDFVSMLNMVKTFNDVTGAGKSAIPVDADPSTAILMKAIDAFGPALADNMSKRASAPPPALPAPAGPQLTTDQEEDLLLFKLQLKAACKAAARGANPEGYADTIYSMLPDDAIVNLVSDPQWFAYLCNAVPECGAHSAWFDAVRNGIVKIGLEVGDLVQDNANLRLATESDNVLESDLKADTNGGSGASKAA